MKTLSALFVFCVCNFSFAQDEVNLVYLATKVGDKTFEIHITATVKEGWHIYSQTVKEGVGSFPTKISFNKNPLIIISGKTKEVGKLITKKEEILDITVKYYRDKVDFVQVVKLKNDVKIKVNGVIEYMTCTEDRCLPPKAINFSIVVGN